LISVLKEKIEQSITSVQAHCDKSRILPPLSIPPPSATLERKDFPNVRFWSLKKWNDYKATRQRSNEAFSKLAFITTTSGEPVANDYLERMSETARSLFTELHARALAPPTWKAKLKTVSDFFVNSIVLEFPELRWCEGGSWKAEAFAVTRYPDCSRKFFNTGSFPFFIFRVLLRPFFSSGDLDDTVERTRKRRKTDQSSRLSKKYRASSPNAVANDDNKESIIPAVPDLSFSLIYTGTHGLSPINADRIRNDVVSVCLLVRTLPVFNDPFLGYDSVEWLYKPGQHRCKQCREVFIKW
jgi:hypothetical protein